MNSSCHHQHQMKMKISNKAAGSFKYKIYKIQATCYDPHVPREFSVSLTMCL